MGRSSDQSNTHSTGTAPCRIAVDDRTIAGHAQDIRLRLYRPLIGLTVPALLYLHGGGFTSGSLEEAETAAAAIAESVPALVVSVGYSLAPAHCFPTATHDAHQAALWTLAEARDLNITKGGLGVAGHDAGGHVAASLTFLARDQGEVDIRAQALLGPMLDPSLTRAGDAQAMQCDVPAAAYARCYRAYLPDAAQRVHPYAAPLDSRRLAGLPPTLIVTAQKDVLRIEAEQYAANLIGAGVPTEVTRFPAISHAALPGHRPALLAVADFFRRRLSPADGRGVPV
ncbi:alpha/beta hydrolase fold domain-containing protein [Azospirillum brasilense]|uniref:alpha/beta hydrolase fold domain-containing protein n=1 Tax=Azospirillum brasilense TaxID=192 RepID=UPI000E68B65C|nr:alpha/beta hydrolase fold domain-containing protein [Azospirillum brasilense]NUB24085.1 alpha/beta hydrolase fold domain-containing protein [Azospirillum brasilense]NUB31206.1 alpha/beta hydrolase fold domain-containing protein [Azospirillum brasilense]RIW04084.1 alpha/beta hydrolase [Azospirillum brasilense]